MAKRRKIQNTADIKPNSFERKLVEDVRDFRLEPGNWTQARNAVNNSNTGDLGSIGNEPSNFLCAETPYPIIGAIYIERSTWVIFSTDDINSEIGLFNEEKCSYSKIVNDPCLNFNRRNLITGVSKENFDCTWQIYWSDGRRNPDRTMNINNVPYIKNCQIINDCEICEDTDKLDCDAIRLAPLVTVPCATITKGVSGGTLPNGSYYVVIAYSVNQQKVTDYYQPSNVQALFDHDNVAGSLDIVIDQIDQNFEEFELVLVSFVNQQTSAKKVGYYSTKQQRITIDIIDNRWPSVPIENIPIRVPSIESSDSIFENGKYLLRIGPSSAFDFNYQPLANQIQTKWVSVQYPEKYYRDGGTNTGYMRDEVYAFFIRWINTNGDRSSSYHIPGRYRNITDFDLVSANALNDEIAGGFNYRWVVYNTASITSMAVSTLPDGGVIIAEGLMGYWESSEYYDKDKPEIWNANIPGHPEWDLCGKPIRHHRFPDNMLDTSPIRATSHFAPGGEYIRIMGVKFENIQPPVDNNGNLIPNIVGYEILRGSREGNKTVIAKGIINNMFEFDIDGDPNTSSFSNRIGLYANYPYNDLRPDKYISKVETKAGSPNIPPQPNDQVSKTVFTFHSPETQFRNPFLSAKELKIYKAIRGKVHGQFLEVDKHPRHKILTNLGFIVGMIGGFASAIAALSGKKTIKNTGPRQINLGGGFVAPGIGGTDAGNLGLQGATSAVFSAYYGGGYYAAQISDIITAAGIALTGGLPEDSPLLKDITENTLSALPFTIGSSKEESWEGGYNDVPLPIRILNGAPIFLNYFSEGTDASIDLIKSFSKYRQYALQYISHCKYTEVDPPVSGYMRKSISDSIYLKPTIQDFGQKYRINNLYRSRAVVIETSSIIDGPIGDNSKQTLAEANGSGAGPTYQKFDKLFTSQAASHYVGLKQRIRNQYGQIEGIIQVPVSTCVIDKSLSTSPVLFNGDIYIGRYTEKNTMFFFYDWLLGQPDGTEFNYLLRKNVPHPAFWLNTENYDFNDLFSSIGTAIGSLSTGALNWPIDNYNLDGPLPGARFTLKDNFMYLFNSGVRDFFVESEINIDLRDWGENDAERHYDPYRHTSLPTSIFNSSIIKSGNFFKYDYSLSISRLFNNFISWGNVQPRYYDPKVAESCYTYYPNRINYSLQNQLESVKDYWRIYLPNNYKDFKSRVTTVKPVNKNGALIFFENESPIQFLGVDQLTTDSGTKITIGDGGLFSQPLQNILSSDVPYEYGSCQNRLSVVNTPSGIFWISQNQGKIFQFLGQIKEISMFDLKWWFDEFLPYKILEDFPNFDLLDNTVIGVGCQTIYDNDNLLVYFCKRDFKLKPDLPVTVEYVDGDNFLVNGILPIKLGDSRYFDDASWTISYDPKVGGWVSYHDWHPNLLLAGKNTFLSIKENGIWVHNSLTNSYCNFYGIDYPFEVEYQSSSFPNITVLRSIEYYMEVFRYASNNYDRFHVLDFNFDEAVIYNTEQCSGLLRLNLSPKNNAPLIVQYPQVNPTYIDILYSKEENKYRINQFWDITDDRGEFNTAAQRMIWNTQPNGYIKTLNPNNLNYNKFATQRKKFRHYTHTILLRRRVSGPNKMIVNLTANKKLNSPR